MSKPFCIQLYHPICPVVYRYGAETISLARPSPILKRHTYQVTVRYCLLIENLGQTAIDTLNFLYPHSLYEETQNGSGLPSWQVNGVRLIDDFAVV